MLMLRGLRDIVLFPKAADAHDAREDEDIIALPLTADAHDALADGDLVPLPLAADAHDARHDALDDWDAVPFPEQLRLTMRGLTGTLFHFQGQLMLIMRAMMGPVPGDTFHFSRKSS